MRVIQIPDDVGAAYRQPDPSTGYRFTAYRIEGGGEWPLTETGYIYHKLDLSDLAEPYLSAVRKTLEAEETERCAQ